MSGEQSRNYKKRHVSKVHAVCASCPQIARTMRKMYGNKDTRSAEAQRISTVVMTASYLATVGGLQLPTVTSEKGNTCKCYFLIVKRKTDGFTSAPFDFPPWLL